jgi:hypothetical protein
VTNWLIFYNPQFFTMDDLLIKYILEEATPEESEQVQQWLAADAANRIHFEKLQAVWKLAAQPLLQPAADPSPALQRLKQTLQARETVPRARDIKRIWLPRARAVWTAAAAVVGIVGVALGAYVFIKPKTAVKEQPPVVQPDTVQHQPLPVDTTPMGQPVHTDTIPIVKPHKKKRSEPVRPVQPVHHKKKPVHQPTHPVDSVQHKKNRHEPVRPVQPVHHKKKPVHQPTHLVDSTRVKKKHPVQPSIQPLPPKKKKANRQPPIS